MSGYLNAGGAAQALREQQAVESQYGGDTHRKPVKKKRPHAQKIAGLTRTLVRILLGRTISVPPQFWEKQKTTARETTTTNRRGGRRKPRSSANDDPNLGFSSLKKKPARSSVKTQSVETSPDREGRFRDPSC